ncbi:MAG: hypothetical protein LCH96_11645 [Actinobacteria bacterium]|nr:hypothetical protein [Actinomycetota bacterium]
MADEGSSTPRRALGPRPDDGDDAAVGGRFARGLSPDEPSALRSTGSFRRLALSPSSPASPEDPLDVPGTTPVPPPAPVLPDPEAALRPASGRRFSASAEPSEFAPAAPRRSAASASSPSSPFDTLPPVARPTAPPARTVPVSAAPPAEEPRSVATAPSAPIAFTPPAPAPASTAPAVASLNTTAAWPSTTTPSPTPPATSTFTPFAPPPQAADAVPAPAAEPAPDVAAPAKKGWFGRTPKADPDAAPAAKADATPTPAKAERAHTPTKQRAPKNRGKKAAAAATTTPPAAPRKERSARPALIIIASVAVVALLVAGGVWLLTLRSGAPSGTPTTTTSALDPLLTAEDLGSLGQVTWQASTGTADAVRPICIPASATGLPEAQRTASRKIGSADVPEASVVQVVDTYADVAAATAAYDLRLAQAGTCKDDTAYIVGANAVTGLADSATAVRLLVQDAADVYHTLLVTRTGRSVSMVDVATTESVPAQNVAQATSVALSRQCGGDLGTCPASPATTTVPPLVAEPKGWLVEADLPRITAGVGRWGGTEPFTALQMPGSQCEGMNLETVTGTTSAGQRTLLLADDPDAPKGFGVDMVTYTFADADGAKTLATKLDKNIGDCAAKYPTATVAAGPDAKGTADAGAKITGSTYLVTQKTAVTSVVYRVAVVTVGSRVVYLLGNPTAKFDFTDAQWKAIAVRAGQRAAQA